VRSCCEEDWRCDDDRSDDPECDDDILHIQILLWNADC
jgi:hypothetical protein